MIRTVGRFFFDIYWRLIYAVALKSGPTDSEAQDVVQETIISVAKNIQKFKRDRKLGSFKGWLRNITRWRIADQLRKRTRADGVERTMTEAEFRQWEEIPGVGNASSESIWEQEWQSNLLKAAMERVRHRVKEEQYQMFDFYVVRQWPVGKVAETLGVSAARVYLAKHRVSRLIKKEVRALEKKWDSI
jgi:RNA polymerase sigma factor (sigma-70 family)